MNELIKIIEDTYPIKWSNKLNGFAYDMDEKGFVRPPHKNVICYHSLYERTLIEAAVLSRLSGVAQDHIIYGTYEGFGEEAQRVAYARQIMKDYMGYLVLQGEVEVEGETLILPEAATVDETSEQLII